LEEFLKNPYINVVAAIVKEFHLKDEDSDVPVFAASTVILADRVAFSFSPALRSP
jgi:hypothetical protein